MTRSEHLILDLPSSLYPNSDDISVAGKTLPPSLSPPLLSLSVMRHVHRPTAFTSLSSRSELDWRSQIMLKLLMPE
uniref:Uncharacterized protein n=1 Tax=Arundo donax TaxID=35708 RepID=A0A0A8XPA6_ARUDO